MLIFNHKFWILASISPDFFMEDTKKAKNPAWAIIFWTFIISLGYAIIRYHIAGPVPWKDLSFFVLNKGNALSAFILLSINFSLGPLKKLGLAIPHTWLKSRKILGIMGFLQVFVHLIMSFILLRPSVYDKFFEADGTLTLFTGLNLIGGITAFIFIWIYNISFNMELRKDKDLIRFITSRKVTLYAILMAGVHLFFMGFEGWLKPGGWHGGLPPISLLAFILFVLAFTINLLGRADSEE
jgi:hypothetical protein